MLSVSISNLQPPKIPTYSELLKILVCKSCRRTPPWIFDQQRSMLLVILQTKRKQKQTKSDNEKIRITVKIRSYICCIYFVSSYFCIILVLYYFCIFCIILKLFLYCIIFVLYFVLFLYYFKMFYLKKNILF